MLPGLSLSVLLMSPLQLRYASQGKYNIYNCYIPINDKSFELSVFWLSDTESRLINELRLSDSVSLSFKTRLTSVNFLCVDIM